MKGNHCRKEKKCELGVPSVCKVAGTSGIGSVGKYQYKISNKVT